MLSFILTSSRSLRKLLKVGTNSILVISLPRTNASSCIENANVLRTFHWKKKKGFHKLTHVTESWVIRFDWTLQVVFLFVNSLVHSGEKRLIWFSSKHWLRAFFLDWSTILYTSMTFSKKSSLHRILQACLPNNLL